MAKPGKRNICNHMHRSHMIWYVPFQGFVSPAHLYEYEIWIVNYALWNYNEIAFALSLMQNISFHFYYVFSVGNSFNLFVVVVVQSVDGWIRAASIELTKVLRHSNHCCRMAIANWGEERWHVILRSAPLLEADHCLFYFFMCSFEIPIPFSFQMKNLFLSICFYLKWLAQAWACNSFGVFWMNNSS